MTEAIPGTRYAFQVVHPGSPTLRIRYRAGIAIDPHGFPDWLPYARAVVELPPIAPGTGLDEGRVLDVLTANAVMSAGDDPLWSGLGPLSGPAGWVWAHLAMTRRIALVPAELHGAHRHLGGVSTGGFDRTRRGLAGTTGSPPEPDPRARLSPEVLDAIEARLGRLPDGYREFLAGTNGAAPVRPAVHPRFGFVADQPFFGVARPDPLQDLTYASAWFADRLTGDFLAIGYVQGGLLAVRTGGGDEGSVWYCDDDDHRDRDGYSAADVCARLLSRCADDFESFWRALREVPRDLGQAALAAAADGRATRSGAWPIGEHLPAARRPRPGGSVTR